MMRRCGKHADCVTLHIDKKGKDFEEKLGSLSAALPNVAFCISKIQLNDPVFKIGLCCISSCVQWMN